MPAKSAQVATKSAHPVDGHPSASAPQTRAGQKAAPQRDLFAPPPLPTDPATLEAIQGSIEEGLADAHAGLGEEWEGVHARIFGQPSQR